MLPLEEALRLVSRFVGQEMRLRTALASGDAIAISPASGAASASAGTLISSLVPLKRNVPSVDH